jgi:hypothetical protein
MMENSPRYIVGIDLGTTHCACYFFDQNLDYKKIPIQRFSFKQYHSEERVKDLPLLPSFIYLLDESDEKRFVQKLPWEDPGKKSQVIGYYAQEHGHKRPSQWIRSAKSWLVHGGVNRKEALLPIEGEGKKLSPLDASFYYLDYIKRAWNHQFRQDGEFLEQQDVIITVPASFDEVARTLTLQAARKAGLDNVSLIEEPQAAFYHQLYKLGDSWQEKFSEGQHILVCDVGGGTTDFSLIEVKKSEGRLYLERSLVGEHLLLGGDNLDLAIAHFLKSQIETDKGIELNQDQFTHLLFQSKHLKEELYNSKEPVLSVFIQGVGSHLVFGGVTFEIERKKLISLVEDGFFSIYNFEEAKKILPKPSLKSIGLPYEKESSISKQLAHFLSHSSGELIFCDYVLFNGGTLKPQSFKDRLLKNLELWFQKKVQVLDDSDLEFSVAKGAAYFGLAKQGRGIKIKAGAPRALYLEVASIIEGESTSSKWLCICSKGKEFGSEVLINKSFKVKANTRVCFRLACSSILERQKEGDLVDFDEKTMDTLPAMEAFLSYGKVSSSHKDLPVELNLALCDTGAMRLEIISKDSEHVWDLAFDFSKKAAGSLGKKSDDLCEVLNKQQMVKLLDQLKFAFDKLNVKDFSFFKDLEILSEKKKNNWSYPVLRGLFDGFMDLVESHLKVSELGLERVFNILGFLLRPGLGVSLDEQRIKRVWRFLLPKLPEKRKLGADCQKWILVRRISGGLSRGQQRQLSGELFKELYDKKKRKIIFPKKDMYLFIEKLRAFSSLERADKVMKTQLARAVLSELLCEPREFLSWSLARIGARRLMHADLTDTIVACDVEEWIEKILASGFSKESHYFLLLRHLSINVDYESLNINASLMTQVKNALEQEKVSGKAGKDFEFSQGKYGDWVAGDNLPLGLSMEATIKV